MNRSAAIYVVYIAGVLIVCIFSSCARVPESPAVAVNDVRQQPRPSPDPDQDLEHDAKLQADADSLLPLFDKMQPVPVYLKDELVQRAGTNTERGAAYTQCYEDVRPVIYFKKIYYRKASRKQLINALKHELTHAFLCRQHLMNGHDARFRQKFKQVGGFGN
jgi:SprT-like family